MAQQFLSVNRGQLDDKLGNITTATTTPTADFFFQILSTNTPTKFDAIRALMMMIRFIESNGLPSGSPGTNLPAN